MKVAVIKYNAGNIRSVSFALERLNIDFSITDIPEEIMSADRVIFPGVGEARTTMSYLRDRKLDKLILQLGQPVLGICLGMQLMCKRSEENNTECLGIFDETARLFKPTSEMKVPHMGWNQLTSVNGWLSNSLENQNAYFVHSYYVPVSRFTSAETEYITTFSAAMRKGNYFAVQFHPEKSAETGEKVLKCFFQAS